MCILLTGFEAFGSHKHNPSSSIAKKLNTQNIYGQKIVGRVLKVDTKLGPATLQRLIAKHKPKAVLMLGLAGDRQCVSLENLAQNQMLFSIPDNAGKVMQGQIVQGGPSSYKSSLPLQQLSTALSHAKIPFEISNNAGNYLCNQVFYVAMHCLQNKKPVVPSGFVHLPPHEKLVQAHEKLVGWATVVPLRQQLLAVTLILEKLALSNS